MPWRDLPDRYGPWETVYKRFARWRADGTWQRIHTHLHIDADAGGELDWDAQVDSTIVRAHQHPAGAAKRGWSATTQRGGSASEFDQGWLAALESTPLARLIVGLTGLTRLGEHPTTPERLAEVVDRPVVETAGLVRGATTARIQGNLIHWDEPFPGERTRRTLYVGDRAVPMNSGCAPDLFAFAAVLDVPFRVEDTDAATGTPIRIDFVPNGVQRVDPPQTVTVLQSLERLRAADGGVFEQLDANVCAVQPFFASAEAAVAPSPEAESSPSRRCSNGPGSPTTATTCGR